MLYTSADVDGRLRVACALTPNPPVQVFGVFVALGILIAWLLTILLIRAGLHHAHPRE
jgi:uncharacterized protein